MWFKIECNLLRKGEIHNVIGSKLKHVRKGVLNIP
jgi:hypothetical protein